MRIKENFKKSGYFWLPSTPDQKHPGTLSISDGGIIDLEIVELSELVGSDSLNWESFDSDALNWEPIFNNHFKRIVGHIETDEVTLDGCKFKEGFPNYRTGLSRSLLRVDRVFTGIKYDEDEILRFKILTFSVDGIDEWIGQANIDVEKRVQGQHISFQHPEPVSFNLPNGMELSITFNQERSGSMSPREDRITQRTYFKLVSQDARELDDFISIVEKIINFLCFAIGDIVCLDNMSATVDGSFQDALFQNFVKDETRMLPVGIYYLSQFYSKDKLRIDFNTLFRFEQIQNDTERIINNWIKSYKQYDSAFRLYFLAKMGGQTYLEEKFLTLVQGLEAYHQRISSNMILKNRLKSIIEPFKDLFGNKEKRKKMVKKIVDTRNYLTHHNPHKEQKAAKGQDLWVLCEKMEALFQLLFLQLIDFSQEEINSIADRQLRRKLQL